jgi:NAD(P)-dependent dehydrogenase (short-subunit alcohol dehydrogenase family)
MSKLNSRVAIVAGISRSRGKNIALALAKAGAWIVVAAQTDAQGGSRIPDAGVHGAESIRQEAPQAASIAM